MANCRQLSVVVGVVVDLQQKVVEGPMLQYVTLCYLTLHYVTRRYATFTIRTREIFLRGAPATATLCVSVCVCVCRCLRARSPFWPNGVRRVGVAADVEKGGERRGCNVDNQQTQCANNSPACIIDEQLLLLLFFFFFCLDWLLLLLLNFFVKKILCIFEQKA